MGLSHHARSAICRVIIFFGGTVLMNTLLVGCGSFQAAPCETRIIAAGDIGSTIESGLFIIRAIIDGSHPVRLVLDTGADATVLTPAAVERIGLETVPILRVVRGAQGGGIEGSKVQISTLDLGGLVLTDFDALVLGLDPIQGRLERPIDGVIGWPAFRDTAVRVEIETGRIRVGDTPEPGGVVYPLTSRRATIEAPIFGKLREYLVDTGYTGTLTIRPDDLSLLASKDLGEQGVSGAYRAGSERRVRVETETDFGGTRMPGSEVFVTGGTRVMGNAWMQRFVVTFDQPSGEIRFRAAESQSTLEISR